MGKVKVKKREYPTSKTCVILKGRSGWRIPIKGARPFTITQGCSGWQGLGVLFREGSLSHARPHNLKPYTQTDVMWIGSLNKNTPTLRFGGMQSFFAEYSPDGSIYLARAHIARNAFANLSASVR